MKKMPAICVIILLSALLLNFQALAASAQTADEHPEKEAIDKATGTIDKFIGATDNQLVKDDNVSALVGNIIKAGLGLLGTVALLVFIYSGIMWMMAGGDEKMVKKAERGMIWAAIGLFAIFASYAIMRYVINALTF